MILKIAEILRRSGREEKGFTLIELLIVLAIIGILVAIGIPVYNTTMKNAARKAHDSNLRMIDSAVQQYIAGTGDYPIGENDKYDIKLLWNDAEKYLEEEPKIPALLVKDKAFGEGVTEYFLDEKGWAQPVGTWDGAYRKATGG